MRMTAAPACAVLRGAGVVGLSTRSARPGDVSATAYAEVVAKSPRATPSSLGAVFGSATEPPGAKA